MNEAFPSVLCPGYRGAVDTVDPFEVQPSERFCADKMWFEISGGGEISQRLPMTLVGFVPEGHLDLMPS